MNLKKLSACGLVVASLSMGTVGAIATAVPAIAAPTVNPANVDPSATYNLAIHKYLGAPNTSLSNDGTAVTGITNDSLSGVVFDIYKVQGVDLTTNAGWAAATDLQGHAITAAEIAAGTITGKSGTTYTIAKTTSVTTDGTGAATFGAAGDAGLYLVNENLAASTTIVDNTTGKAVASGSVTPSAPFLVTLPMTDPVNTSSWLSTVNVYPKNTSDSLTKAVKDVNTATVDSGTTLGHVVDYTLSGTITPGLTGTQMGTYVIADKLDPRLTFDSIKQVVIQNSSGATTATLTAGADYQVYVNGVLNGTPAGGDTVQIVMTDTGLGKLSAAESADAASHVVVDLLAKVTTEGTGATAGDIPNTAVLIPNLAYWNSKTGESPTSPYNPTTDNPTSPSTPGVPSNKVDSKYGDLNLTKVDASDATKTLAGAVFSLYQTTGSSMTPTAADCANVTANGSPILQGVKTDSSGLLTIKGLQESDFYNGATQTSNYLVYCLVETTAPSGYNLLAQPVPFVISQAGTSGASLTVKNEQHNLGNSLPLTGGKGAATMGLGGLALLGGGAAVLVMRRRRADEDAADDLV